MTDEQALATHGGVSPFDQIRHEDEQGEWWSARELAELLGYVKWQPFAEVIKEALTASNNQGYDASILFTHQSKKSTGGRPSQDYRLARFACYMVALSADGTKDEVAAAKVYFAVMTRRQEEQEDPDTIDADYLEWQRRTINSYMAHGHSYEWAAQRTHAISVRNKLTDEWSVRGIKDGEYAILTDVMHMNMFGLHVQTHMGIKEFPVTYKGKRAVYKGDLREALTDMEMAVTTVGEVVARRLHITNNSQGFGSISADVSAAGKVAASTRKEMEAATGQSVISSRNMIREPDGGLWQQLSAPKEE